MRVPGDPTELARKRQRRAVAARRIDRGRARAVKKAVRVEAGQVRRQQTEQELQNLNAERERLLFRLQLMEDHPPATDQARLADEEFRKKVEAELAELDNEITAVNRCQP